MKTMKLIAIAVLAVSVASCCSCRTKSRSAGSLTGNSWQLIKMENDAVTTRGENYTIDFGSDNRISGMGDCNRLMGGYTWDARGKLSFQGTASTRMMCPDQDTESRFLRLLDSIDSYRVDGNTLMLLDGGRTILVFKKI